MILCLTIQYVGWAGFFTHHFSRHHSIYKFVPILVGYMKIFLVWYVELVGRKDCPPYLADYKKNYPQGNEAMTHAYLSGANTMAEIGQYFKVHYMKVSRTVKKLECL